MNHKVQQHRRKHQSKKYREFIESNLSLVLENRGLFTDRIKVLNKQCLENWSVLSAEKTQRGAKSYNYPALITCPLDRLSHSGIAIHVYRQRGPVVASFPGSPSFRAIIPRMTFDPPEGKALFLRAGQRSHVELLRGRRESLGTSLFLRAGQRSYVELLHGRRESLGTRLAQLQD